MLSRPTGPAPPCAAASGARPAAAPPGPRRRAAQRRWASGTGRRRGCCGRWAGSAGERIRSPPGTGAMKRPDKGAQEGRDFGVVLQVPGGLRRGPRRRRASAPDSRRAGASVIGRPRTWRPSVISAPSVSSSFSQSASRSPASRSTACACSRDQSGQIVAVGRVGRQGAEAGEAVLQVDQALVEARTAPAAASGG